MKVWENLADVGAVMVVDLPKLLYCYCRSQFNVGVNELYLGFSFYVDTAI